PDPRRPRSTNGGRESSSASGSRGPRTGRVRIASSRRGSSRGRSTEADGDGGRAPAPGAASCTPGLDKPPSIEAKGPRHHRRFLHPTGLTIFPSSMRNILDLIYEYPEIYYDGWRILSVSWSVKYYCSKAISTCLFVSWVPMVTVPFPFPS